MSQNYKLEICYDGTNYGGWQIQPNAMSIQAILENALQIILRQEITLVGSGRTDAGVHALEQVAHFRYSNTIVASRFLFSLNSLIPADIRVKSITPMQDKFHAQHSVLRKTYRYNLCFDAVQNPFNRLYSWHIRRRLDFSAIEKACAHLQGTHDFTSFANEAHKGSASKDPIRTIFSAIFHNNGQNSYLEFTADGFLYRMVRSLVGTLIEVGSGKIKGDDIPFILAAKDRSKAGQAAPAHGLFLMHVEYPSDL